MRTWVEAFNLMYDTGYALASDRNVPGMISLVCSAKAGRHFRNGYEKQNKQLGSTHAIFAESCVLRSSHAGGEV